MLGSGIIRDSLGQTVYFLSKIKYNEEDEILADKTRDKGVYDKAHEKVVQEINIYLRAIDYFSKNKIERKKALLEDIYSRRTNEIDIYASSGMFNSIIKGYCLFALEEAGCTTEIDFNKLFDTISAEKAEKRNK